MYRILCDENVPPQTIRYLRKADHDVDHVIDVLQAGDDDTTIAATAREREQVILTNDADFLDASAYPDVSVLYYPNNRLSPYEVAELVSRVAAIIPNQEDLPRTVFLTEDNL